MCEVLFPSVACLALAIPNFAGDAPAAKTYNKLRVTYEAYLGMLPELTPAQKQVIFDRLKEARDRAVYAGSAEEKSDVFNKYKGRINNYLSAQGYDPKLAEKRWAERRKQAK